MTNARAGGWNPLDDLAELRLGDRRRNERARRVMQRAVAAPGDSFPEMLITEAELEGFYRLASNDDVSPRALLAPHQAATGERAGRCEQPVIVAHDTTVASFGGEGVREGVGTVANGGTGLTIHVALGLRFDGLPLGLLDLQTHTRLSKAPTSRPPADRESARWAEGVRAATARVGRRAIHVMDREADAYLLLDELIAGEHTFVVRVSQRQRKVVDAPCPDVGEAADAITVQFAREVPLAVRSDYRRQQCAKETHPARVARVATLGVGARTVTLQAAASHRSHATHATLSVHLVRVWEPTPVDGEPAVEWLLYTNLPIVTPEDLAFVVDCYRRRWVVEEYFKALKTGCAIEDRQLESRHSLEIALAFLAPIAVHLVLLRTLARTAPDAPATAVLSPLHFEVLRAISQRFKVSPTATVHDVLFAIAGLGGFLKRNRVPGWQTIGRGHERLMEAVIGWKAAKGLA